MVDDKKVRQDDTSKDESDNFNSNITIAEISYIYKSLKSVQNSNLDSLDGFLYEMLKICIQEITPLLLKL